MLGIIVSALDQEGQFSDVIYHKFGKDTVFEYALDNALKAEQAQRVIVLAPGSERKNIKGTGMYHPLVKGDRSYLGRKASFHFYSDDKDFLSGLYFAALTYGLDHIVLVHANCPLLPAWLINDMIFTYMCNTDRNNYMTNIDPKPTGQVTFSGYDLAFGVQIFPFWMLANEFLYAEERSALSFRSWPEKDYQSYLVHGFHNEGKSYLPSSKLDLRFTSLEQRNEFEFLLNESAKGADLGNLIEELNESEEA